MTPRTQASVLVSVRTDEDILTSLEEETQERVPEPQLEGNDVAASLTAVIKAVFYSRRVSAEL